jgi:hypothetical protein
MKFQYDVLTVCPIFDLDFRRKCKNMTTFESNEQAVFVVS